MALKENDGIEIHGLGIQLQKRSALVFCKAEVESRNATGMVSSAEKGDLYYEFS